MSFQGQKSLLARPRYYLAFIAYGFLVLRLIHTGYPPIFSFLLALAAGLGAIYALGALASDSPKIPLWPKAERQSAKIMAFLLLLATLALIVASLLFPLPERGSFKFW